MVSIIACMLKNHKSEAYNRVLINPYIFVRLDTLQKELSYYGSLPPYKFRRWISTVLLIA